MTVSSSAHAPITIFLLGHDLSPLSFPQVRSDRRIRLVCSLLGMGCSDNKREGHPGPSAGGPSLTLSQGEPPYRLP